MRILYLLPFPPQLDATHGGARVTAELVSRIARRHDVALLYLRGAEEPPADTRVLQRCSVGREVARPDRPSAFHRLRTVAGLVRGIPTWATDWDVDAFGQQASLLESEWQPDLIEAHYSVMGQYLPRLRAPRLLVEHEPPWSRADERAQSGNALRRVTARLEARAWRRYVRRVLEDTEAVAVFTEADGSALRVVAPTTKVVVAPFGVELTRSPLADVQADTVLFVGNMRHAPNVYAARRLAREIFPRVLASRHHTRLILVGAAPPPEIRELAGRSVTIAGDVADVRDWLDRAAVVAAPLDHGGGMRVKVLEALAAGKPLVATPQALAGLRLGSDPPLIVAESDDEFASALLSLLDDDSRRTALSSAARSWAEAELGWPAAIARFERLHESLLSTP
jgi:glycosyltransferase involved in cell wall biosynthesis